MIPLWILVLSVLVLLALSQFGRTATDDGQGENITFTCKQCGRRERHRNVYLDLIHTPAICRFCGGEQTHQSD